MTPRLRPQAEGLLRSGGTIEFLASLLIESDPAKPRRQGGTYSEVPGSRK